MDGQNFPNENEQTNDVVNAQAGGQPAESENVSGSYSSNSTNTYMDNTYQSNTANTYQDNTYQSNTANTYQTNNYQDKSYQSNLNTGYQDNSYQSSINNTYQSGNTYQDNTATYTAPNYNNGANVYGEPEAPKTPGVSIASLVLGIAGIVFDCCCGVGLLFGIIGLILAIVGNKQQKTGVGTAGLICSIIAIVFGVFYLIYVIAVGGASMLQEMM